SAARLQTRRSISTLAVRCCVWSRALHFWLLRFDAMSSEVTSWATATSKQESTGRVVVFRYARSFRETFARATYPVRVILVWKYESQSGMPKTSEREAMDRMEDLLEPRCEELSVSVLALVSTGENVREWIFYAKTEDLFFAALNEALAGEPEFPIEIHAGPDP